MSLLSWLDKFADKRGALLVLFAITWIPLLLYEFVTSRYLLRTLAGVTIPIGLAGAVFLAWRRKSYKPFILFLLNPLVLHFGFGVAEWFSERPRFFGWGLPTPEAANLDPKLRCYYASGGCVVVGGEWVFDGPHNAGLRVTALLFGNPPHVYQGPYPTEEEATKLTADVPTTNPDDFLQGLVVVGGRTMSLGQPLVANLLQDLDQTDFDLNGNLAERWVRAAIYKNECLIVRVRTKNLLLGENSDRFMKERMDHDGCLLFDVRTMRPFARYGFQGSLPQICIATCELRSEQAVNNF